MTKTGENRFLLVYGSQTGQAQAIAEEIAENAPKHGLHADLHGLDKTEKKFWLERECCAVIVTSTTGDGEVPDNAQKFWRRLKKKTLPSDHLKDLHFALLGLGDSNYTNFCNCGKAFNKRLLDLGAKHFYPPGWADDATGLELVVEPWMESLFSALQRHLGVPPGDISDIPDAAESGASICNGHVEPLPEANSSPGEPSDSCRTSEESLLNECLPKQSVECSGQEYGKSGNMASTISSSKTIESRTSETSDINPNQRPEFADTFDIHVCDNTVDGPTSTPIQSVVCDTTKKLENLELTCTSQSDSTVHTADSVIRDWDDKPVGDQPLGGGELCVQADLTNSLTVSYPPLCDNGLILPALPPSFLRICYKPDESPDLDSIPIHNGCPLPSAKSEVSMVPVVRVTQLTSDDSPKKALKVVLDMSSCGWTYQPGDAIGIICPNPEEEVEQLLCRLDLVTCADTKYELSIVEGTKKRNPSVPKHIPESGTLRHTLTTCVDIHCVPKKAFLRTLVEHTSNLSQKVRLQELCSKQGADHYSKYVRETSLSLLELLSAFPSCQPPITCILEHLPRLQPRPYSAASSLSVHPGELHFVFNITDIPARGQHQPSRKGVCTGWLERLTLPVQHGPVEDVTESLARLKCSEIQLPVFLRSNSSFRPPGDLSKPVIMIGPGTGVSPFIGFLQDRQATQARGDPDVTLGETWLFFGCRHQDKDFIFREELEHFKSQGILTHFYVSFSRDVHPEGAPRYVQDNLRRNTADILHLIDKEEAIVFVCGDATGMARDVLNTFTEIVQEKGISQKEASDYLLQMRIYKRYLEDVWT